MQERKEKLYPDVRVFFNSATTHARLNDFLPTSGRSSFSSPHHVKVDIVEQR